MKSILISNTLMLKLKNMNSKVKAKRSPKMLKRSDLRISRSLFRKIGTTTSKSNKERKLVKFQNDLDQGKMIDHLERMKGNQIEKKEMKLK